MAAPIFLETDTIEELASKAQHVFEIRTPLRRQQTRQNSRQPATSHQARSSAIPGPAATPRGPLPKLTDIEREYLRANKGCFRCRKLNTGHMAVTCLEKSASIGNVAISTPPMYVKTETVDAVDVAESECSDPYLHPNHPLHLRSMRIPKIPIRIQHANAPAIADIDASVNVLSNEVTAKH